MPTREPTARAPRPRRVRSTTESLTSIVLGLEAVLMFFVTLTAFGLKVVEPAVAFGGGGLLLVLLLVVSGLVRYPWGLALGWVMQAVLIATGIFLPAMFVIGAGFAAIWTFCFIKGRQLDHARAIALGATTTTQPTNTGTASGTAGRSEETA